ncbi:unnamed protein product, partial [Didymodactylos carnosus]
QNVTVCSNIATSVNDMVTQINEAILAADAAIPDSFCAQHLNEHNHERNLKHLKEHEQRINNISCEIKDLQSTFQQYPLANIDVEQFASIIIRYHNSLAKLQNRIKSLVNNLSKLTDEQFDIETDENIVHTSV